MQMLNRPTPYRESSDLDRAVELDTSSSPGLENRGIPRAIGFVVRRLLLNLLSQTI